jgi:hypothetical protein
VVRTTKEEETTTQALITTQEEETTTQALITIPYRNSSSLYRPLSMEIEVPI